LHDVRVAPHSGGEATRFEPDREEPLKEGDPIRQLSMVYRVKRILPGSDDFDAIVEAEWVAGPAQAEYTGD
jgi:hypothetical protein